MNQTKVLEKQQEGLVIKTDKMGRMMQQQEDLMEKEKGILSHSHFPMWSRRVLTLDLRSAVSDDMRCRN